MSAAGNTTSTDIGGINVPPIRRSNTGSGRLTGGNGSSEEKGSPMGSRGGLEGNPSKGVLIVVFVVCGVPAPLWIFAKSRLMLC